MSNNNSLNDLIDVLRSKSALIESKNDVSDEREDFGVLFMKALKKTVIEIQRGSDTDDFAELTIVNLIIMSDKEGYSSDEINNFVQQLKSYEN